MRAARGLPLFAALLLGATGARAQGLSADLYVGNSRYERVAAALDATSLVAGLRYGLPASTWLYGVAAAPLDDSGTSWGAAGGSHRSRLTLGSRAGAGVDAGGHAYLYRDELADATGRGITAEAGSFLDAVLGRTRAELRVGWRQHLAADGPDRTSRSAPEAGLRLETTGPVHVGGGLRWLNVPEGDFAVATLDVAATAGPLRIWASGEQWLSSEMDDVGWSLYASLPLGRADVWAGLRHDARDPLYWNPGRRAWNVGLTLALGAQRRAVAPVATTTPEGLTRVRLHRSAAAGPVSVAADFTGWEPRLMRPAGDWWEFDVPLQPGVYHYAFIDAAGQWFVPADVPGRMDDGMGGHVAMLVVP